MKKFLSTFLAFLVLIIPFTLNAQIVGHIYKTDIKAYENYFRIPSYNCDGSTVIFARDLENYGYDVLWNEKTGTVNITKNPSKKITPIAPVFGGHDAPGTILFDVYKSDIKTYFEKKEVPSYNIGGKIAIKLRSLESSGIVTFDNTNLKAIHTTTKTSLSKSDTDHINYVYDLLDIMALVDNDILAVKKSATKSNISALTSSSKALENEMETFSSYAEPSAFSKSSMELWWSMVNLNLATNVFISDGNEKNLDRYLTDSLQQRKNALAILATEF